MSGNRSERRAQQPADAWRLYPSIASPVVLKGRPIVRAIRERTELALDTAALRLAYTLPVWSGYRLTFEPPSPDAVSQFLPRF